MKIVPMCLSNIKDEMKPAAYTSDGFMLPCCWLDDPSAYSYIKSRGLKDDELLVSNNDKLETIFTSNQWENFFQGLIHDPKNSSNMCKNKCGVGFDSNEIYAENVIIFRKLIKDA
jgi:hypothetical protein